MIGTLTFVIFLVIAGIYAAGALSSNTETTKDSYGREKKAIKDRYGITIGAIVVLGIVIAFGQPYAVEKIDPGFVGLKVNLIGDQRGVSKFQYRTGWVVYNIYTEQVVEIPSSQQHVEYEATGIARGGFTVNIAPSFNYEIIPENAGDMYVSLRRTLPEVQATWLKTACIGATNDVINRWAVDSIFNHRSEFEAEVMGEMNKRTTQWFRLSQIRTNITPPQSLQKAIAEKTAAVQEAQAAQAKNAVIHMENLNKIMEARGDSAKNVIEAKGLAEVMRIKKIELTPMYIEFLKVQTWNGVTPTTVLGEGTSTTLMVK